MRNKYPGPCYRCGITVAPGDGHFEKIRGGGWRVQHALCCIKAREEISERDRLNKTGNAQGGLSMDASERRYEVHGDCCPHDCMINATESQVLDVYGPEWMDGPWRVTADDLRALAAPGKSFERFGWRFTHLFTIYRTL